MSGELDRLQGVRERRKDAGKENLNTELTSEVREVERSERSFETGIQRERRLEKVGVMTHTSKGNFSEGEKKICVAARNFTNLVTNIW